MDDKSREKGDELYDVIIVGAGISGINMAHHIQQKLPDLTYAILEGRSNIGGTWDLFRYPGIRSDTDLHTFGYGWDPWTENRVIADGECIARYLATAAQKDGISQHIQCDRQVVSANWTSECQLWDLGVKTARGLRLCYQARFLILGTGYYDYTEPLSAEIPGLRSDFKGTLVHPQFWPENLDYDGKRIVIIGSGATAITLLPSLAKRAGQVTMLQRSPTYIMSINNKTGGSWFHKILPQAWSFKIDRVLFMWMIILIFRLSRAFPTMARTMLQKHVAQQLPSSIPMNPHFQPLYNPWDQRLCFTPDGDFFEALRNGHASVETGRIEAMTDHSIILESGRRIDADIIVTATGLKLCIGGRITFTVNNQEIRLADRFAWRSALLQDVPNLAFMIGYVNASWTLGAETSAQVVCRILRHMQTKQYVSVIPRIPESTKLEPRLMWNLDATYVKASRDYMPMCAQTGPWRGRTNYFLDMWRSRYGSITEGLRFS